MSQYSFATSPYFPLRVDKKIPSSLDSSHTYSEPFDYSSLSTVSSFIQQPSDSSCLSISSKEEKEDRIQQQMHVRSEERRCQDRFIPKRVINISHEISVDEDEVKDQSCISQLYRECVINKVKSQSNFYFENYRNNNRLRFTYPQQKMKQKSILAGMELRDNLKGFRNRLRKVNKVPVKVLDAPALQDDFYLNLVDWSPHNLLSVGLATSAYLWNPDTAEVNKLCQMGIRNFITSVSCARKDPLIALGTQSGVVQVWDLEKSQRVRSFGGHTQRVGVIAWNNSFFSTGSRDNCILNRDLRSSIPYVGKLEGHFQEVCGLKWSPDEQQLCSGSNDNQLLVWSKHSDKSLFRYCDHKAAVKALCWSPHQHGLLVSGGGTADRSIKFRNTLTGETVSSWETGSQVCNLMFSRTVNQLVSTHGYSKNEVIVWDASTMKQVISLQGHTLRVLYLAMSPDATTIVTGAGDETLRFWKIFPSTQSKYAPERQLQSNFPVLR